MSLSARTARPDAVVIAAEVARALRVGGQTIPPGESKVVSVSLPDRADGQDAIPVWVAAGTRPGPRVSVVAAPRGFEIGAARVAAGLRAVIDPELLHGGLLVVPVLRPGGRFSVRGRAQRERPLWEFPGDPGGKRRARQAFALFSEIAVGSSLLVLLTAADPGLGAAPTAYGDFEDPRLRRLLAHLGGVVAAVQAKPLAGSLGAAAHAMGAAVLELRCPTEGSGEQARIALVVAILAAVGTNVQLPAPVASAAPPAITKVTALRAPIGGLLEQVSAAGSFVEKGGLLARIVPTLPGREQEVLAPHDGTVLQASVRGGVRARALLFTLGRLSPEAVARARRSSRRAKEAEASSIRPLAGPDAGPGRPMRVGWVEKVSLPGLGVDRLRAKIDTGARTSALHVSRMTTVGTTADPHRRTIVELTLAAGSRRRVASHTVRALVREYVQVKDSSGRTERRPVIETTLRLGGMERRIRVTLTNRGDMLFPLLIGRTALGPGVVVDPARRLLLAPPRAPRLRKRAEPSPIRSALLVDGRTGAGSTGRRNGRGDGKRGLRVVSQKERNRGSKAKTQES